MRQILNRFIQQLKSKAGNSIVTPANNAISTIKTATTVT